MSDQKGPSSGKKKKKSPPTNPNTSPAQQPTFTAKTVPAGVEHLIQVHVDSTSEDESLASAASKRRRISPVSPYFTEHEPMASYQSDREVVLNNPSKGTLQETHVLQREGMQDVYYTEEHWSSTIKSFVTNAPPTFKQVIKAYRVKSSDRLTLVCEVTSQPPATLKWSCNDLPFEPDPKSGVGKLGSTGFMVQQGLNISTLTIEFPVQGVYSCSAENSAGISRSYGYITIDDSKNYDIEAATEEQQVAAVKQVVRRPPQFLNQIPHFVLKPDEEALIDVEVDDGCATPTIPIKFTWYVDGKQLQADGSSIQFYHPKPTRCVAKLTSPNAGQYTVVAQNEFGASKSTGVIEIPKAEALPHQQLLETTDAACRAIPPHMALQRSLASAQRRAASITRTTTHTTTYIHRSSSLPRSPPMTDSAEVTEQMRKSATPTAREGHAPVFLNQLPSEILLHPNEKLVLVAEVSASPTAEIKWDVDGTDIAASPLLDNYSVVNEDNKSTLVVQPPVQQGRYSIEVSNAYGRASFQTVVTHSLMERHYQEVQEVLGDMSTTEGGEDVKFTKVIRTKVENEQIVPPADEIDGFICLPSLEEEEMNRNVYIKTYMDTLVPSTQEVPLAAHAELLKEPLIPVIVVAPERQLFVPGNLPLILEMKVASSTACVIKWYYKNFEIPPTSDAVVLEASDDGKFSRLTHKQPLEGIYKAVVTNQCGIAHCEVQVLVEFPETKDEQKLPEDIITNETLSTCEEPRPVEITEGTEPVATKAAVEQKLIADEIHKQYETIEAVEEKLFSEAEEREEVDAHVDPPPVLISEVEEFDTGHVDNQLSTPDKMQYEPEAEIIKPTNTIELSDNDSIKESLTKTTDMQKEEGERLVL